MQIPGCAPTRINTNEGTRGERVLTVDRHQVVEGPGGPVLADR